MLRILLRLYLLVAALAILSIVMVERGFRICSQTSSSKP